MLKFSHYSADWKKHLKNKELLATVVFVLLVIIFIVFWANLEKQNSNSKSVEENLKAELLKNPVQSFSSSSSQSTQNSQVTNNAVQTNTSQSEIANSDLNVNSENSDIGNTTPADNGTKKFESSTLNASFDYPKDAVVSEGANLITIAKNSISWKIKFYDNKNKKDFQTWYADHFNIKTATDCSFTDATIKIGSYTSNLVKASSDSVKCDGDGNYAINTDKSKVVKIETGKETADNINKILASFKFEE